MKYSSRWLEDCQNRIIMVIIQTHAFTNTMDVLLRRISQLTIFLKKHAWIDHHAHSRGGNQDTTRIRNSILYSISFKHLLYYMCFNSSNLQVSGYWNLGVWKGEFSTQNNFYILKVGLNVEIRHTNHILIT